MVKIKKTTNRLVNLKTIKLLRNQAIMTRLIWQIKLIKSMMIVLKIYTSELDNRKPPELYFMIY